MDESRALWTAKHLQPQLLDDQLYPDATSATISKTETFHCSLNFSQSQFLHQSLAHLFRERKIDGHVSLSCGTSIKCCPFPHCVICNRNDEPQSIARRAAAHPAITQHLASQPSVTRAETRGHGRFMRRPEERTWHFGAISWQTDGSIQNTKNNNNKKKETVVASCRYYV